MGGFVKKIGKSVFGSKLGKIDPILGLQKGYFDIGKGMLGDIDGSNAADAAADAARLQYNAAMAGVGEQRAARESIQKNLQPFMNVGTSNIGAYQDMLTPQGQYNYLQNNPMFAAAIKNTGDQLKGRASATGKFNSGGLVNQLFQNYLGTGENYINSQFGRLGQAVNLGQNSAAMQGNNLQTSASNIANLLGQGGNALASGQIGAANASAQGTSNLIGLAGLAASFFSDERLKDDMEPIGKDENGMTLYKFRYKINNPLFVGYSAQEVAQKDPSNAMLDPSGFLKVSAKYKPQRVA